MVWHRQKCLCHLSIQLGCPSNGQESPAVQGGVMIPLAGGSEVRRQGAAMMPVRSRCPASLVLRTRNGARLFNGCTVSGKTDENRLHSYSDCFYSACDRSCAGRGGRGCRVWIRRHTRSRMDQAIAMSQDDSRTAWLSLSLANLDVGTLLPSTGIATIFLDSSGRVKGFTPSVAEVWPLRSTHIGDIWKTCPTVWWTCPRCRRSVF